MNNSLIRTILGVVCSVVLSITLFLLVRGTFMALSNKHMTDLDKISNISFDHAHEIMSTDEITTYDEVPDIKKDGDVIKLKDWQVRIKINGRLIDTKVEEAGYYEYNSLDTSTKQNLTIEEKVADVDVFYESLNDYWHGESANILTNNNVESSPEDESSMQFYQSTVLGQPVPVIYSDVTKNWYMFIGSEDKTSYIQITAKDPICLTTEQATAHFDDPSVNYQDKHKYSMYEEWATTATIKHLMEEEGARTKEGLKSDEYVDEDDSVITADGQNTSLQKTRDAKAKIGTLKFDDKGVSDDGTKLDIDSNEAKKSQWLLTEDTYYYTSNGLSVYTLAASRSKEIFKVSGTIENTTQGKHPYVIVIKFLDAKDKLLGVKVIDKRESPLDAGKSEKFETQVSPTQDGIEISKISSLMFEMY